MAAEIEKYAEASGTIVVCPPPEMLLTTPDGTIRGSRSGKCQGDRPWGLIEFGVLGADPSDLSAFIHWPNSDAQPSLYHTTAIPLETGRWHLTGMAAWMIGGQMSFRYELVADPKEG